MLSVVLASSFSRLCGKLMKERETISSCLIESGFGTASTDYSTTFIDAFSDVEWKTAFAAPKNLRIHLLGERKIR